MTARPFELHLQTIDSEVGETRTLYSYVLNPSSGVAPHLCGGLRTTGCTTRAAAEAFVRQRIAELVGAPSTTSPPDDCTPLLEDSERLRAFAEERGWLFFRGLLPAAEVQQVRHDLLAVVERHGGLEEGSDPDAGVTRAGVVFEGSNPTDAYRRYTNELLAVHSFNALDQLHRLGARRQRLGAELLHLAVAERQYLTDLRRHGGGPGPVAPVVALKGYRVVVFPRQQADVAPQVADVGPGVAIEPPGSVERLTDVHAQARACRAGADSQLRPGGRCPPEIEEGGGAVDPAR